MQSYYTDTLRCSHFMCASGTNVLPPVLAEIVKAHSNQGMDGAAAIRSAIDAELGTYYNPVKWYGYYFVSIFKGNSAWELHSYGGDDKKLGSTGYVKDYLGYDIVYAWVPLNYSPKLPASWVDCAGKGAKDRLNCLTSRTSTYWYAMAFQDGGTWFYANTRGAGLPGGACSTQPCKSTDRQLYWFSGDKKNWIALG